MKKMNNKGFAISTMLYGLLILIVLIIAMILSTMAFNRKNSREFSEQVVDELEGLAPNYKCKRATTLHTETCSEGKTCTYSNHMQIGDVITYGNIGTSGLSLGDAYDCDVNGDGTYNQNTERFYYLRDETENTSSSNALLVYYSNTLYNSNATMNYNSSVGTKYNTVNNSYQGPTKAVVSLPSKTVWKNTDSFSANAGYVLDELGSTKTFISYTDYGARLLTYKDVKEQCGTNAIYNQCNFLLENTKYANNSLEGLWLSTPSSNGTPYAWYINSGGGLSYQYITFEYGVRPVIAIKKENIEY